MNWISVAPGCEDVLHTSRRRISTRACLPVVFAIVLGCQSLSDSYRGNSHEDSAHEAAPRTVAARTSRHSTIA